MKKRGLAILMTSAMALLCSCSGKAPSGQVVATVNGQEITRNELSAEPEMASLPAGVSADAALPKVLEAVIARKLAVGQAKDLKIDQRPEFVAQQLRTNETMLGQQLLDLWAGQAPQPGAGEVAAFIAAHPQTFAGHKILTLDRVITEDTDTRPLEPLNTVDDITAYFTRIGHKFSRGKSQIDSGSLTTPLYNQLIGLGMGIPLIVKQGPILQIMAVEQVQDMPVKPEDQSAMAANLLRKQAAVKKLETLRKSAKVVYNPEFQSRIKS